MKNVYIIIKGKGRKVQAIESIQTNDETNTDMRLTSSYNPVKIKLTQRYKSPRYLNRLTLSAKGMKGNYIRSFPWALVVGNDIGVLHKTTGDM